jgi:hypothetical protein
VSPSRGASARDPDDERQGDGNVIHGTSFGACPAEFAQFDTRGIIRHSIKVWVREDRTCRRASRIADKLNAELEAVFLTLLIQEMRRLNTKCFRIWRLLRTSVRQPFLAGSCQQIWLKPLL